MEKETYIEHVRSTALKTFEMICFMFPLAEQEAEEYGMEHPDRTIRSMVRFTGAREGGLVVTPSRELRLAIASNLLGEDQVDRDTELGALMEIANILCGNVAPLFAGNRNICSIHPPEILGSDEDPDRLFSGYIKESLEIPFDGGVAEIMIYYSS